MVGLNEGATGASSPSTVSEALQICCAESLLGYSNFFGFMSWVQFRYRNE